MIDGAYHRQIMLDELMAARDIFVARPIKYRWEGPLPKSWPDLEDLKTVMSFDGGYRCERDKVENINKLIHDHAISETHRDKYHRVHLYEVELNKPRSFFWYVFEDETVFTDAGKEARKVFEKFLTHAMAA